MSDGWPGALCWWMLARPARWMQVVGGLSVTYISEVSY